VKVIAGLKQVHFVFSNYSYKSVGSYRVLLDCWKEKPKERPNFSKLVDTISLILEAAAGYMELSLCVKDEHPHVDAEVEVNTRADDSSVQLPSEKEGGGQQETAM